MRIKSVRWPDDLDFVCPSNSNISLGLDTGEWVVSQTIDSSSGAVTGLICTWTGCPCEQQHSVTISVSDLTARNIPECVQSQIVKATLAGTLYP